MCPFALRRLQHAVWTESQPGGRDGLSEIASTPRNVVAESTLRARAGIEWPDAEAIWESAADIAVEQLTAFRRNVHHAFRESQCPVWQLI